MRRALEATELTDLGINLYFFGGSGFPLKALGTAFQLNNKLHDQELFHALDVVLVQDSEVVKVAFLLSGLLGEDVAVISVLPLDLSRSGKRKALFGTGVGFKLCHCVKQLIIIHISEILRFAQNDNCHTKMTTVILRTEGPKYLYCHTEDRSISTLFLFYRSQHHGHSLAFQGGHAFCPSEFFQFNCEAEKLLFPLLGKLDGASAEEDGGLDLGPFLQELLGVLELELEVVFVRIGAEADFLDDYLGRIGFHLLGTLALLVQVLLVIQDLAHGRVCLGADFHQVQFHFFCHGEGLEEGIDSRFGDVVPYQANLGCSDFTVDAQGVFVLLLDTGLYPSGLFGTRRSGFERRCDSVAPLKR